MGGNSGRGEQVRVSDGRTHDGSGRGDGRGRARARGRDDAPRTRAEGGAGLREEHVDALAPGSAAMVSFAADVEPPRRRPHAGTRTSSARVRRGDVRRTRVGAVVATRARDAGLVVLGGAEEGPGEGRAHSQPRGLECPRRRVVHEPRGKTDARARRGRPTRVSTRSSSLTRIFVGAARRAREIGRSRDFPRPSHTVSRASGIDRARVVARAGVESARGRPCRGPSPPRRVS